MTTLREWVKWLARDKDGELWAYSDKPFKINDAWDGDDYLDMTVEIEETDETFSHIKWEDEEPTEIEQVLETRGASAGNRRTEEVGA